MPPPTSGDKEEALKRLGEGRWQTRDERFTIEPQSGTWAVVDSEQTDDLGLPLVRGPFGSLGAAKAAITSARGEAAPSSPISQRKVQPEAGPAPSTVGSESKTVARGGKPKKPVEPKERERPEEPRWFRDLEADERRRAARLIERLTAAGARDPEGTVRRDLVGDVPAVAAYAVSRALRELGDDPAIAEVADTLTDGRDVELGVRWRLVDADGRAIRLDPDQLRTG